MVGPESYKTRIYNDQMNPRKRTLRFIEDNAETFLDYPQNKVYTIDREDLSTLTYYKTTFADRCFYSGFILTSIFAVQIFIKYRKDMRLISLPLAIFPMPMAAGYHYYRLGQFLDYCEIKYKDRGINDADLWEYHRKNNKHKFN